GQAWLFANFNSEGSTSHIKAAADLTTALDQKSVHIEACGNTRDNKAQIKRILIVHHGVDGVSASGRYNMIRGWCCADDHETHTFGKHVYRAVTSWHAGVAIDSSAQVRIITHQANVSTTAKGSSIGI